MNRIIEPFRALRVDPRHAEAVAAPPYDVLDSDEARALADGNPDSFLHVSKPEIDFPPGTDPHGDEVHLRGRASLDRLVATGRLLREAAPCLYLYRLVMGRHTQVGVVGAASVQAYCDGRIRRHEHTREDKVEDRTRNADALNAHTGTLFLTYPAADPIDTLVDRLTLAAPAIDFTAPDGIRHSLWVVESAGDIDRLSGAFEAMPALYIADGHHRSAAAERLRDRRAARIAAGEQVAPAERFLAVAFPDDQVQILAYNRVLATVGERGVEGLVEDLSGAFAVSASPVPVEPDTPGVFGMYAGGGWYRLVIRPERVPSDPVGRLDINLLERHCLTPLLGIADQRTDDRIDFVGGIRGLSELERRVDEGPMKVAFALHPTRLADMFDVADAGEVMPPKSTWFEPKLRDGILVLPLD